jgi:DNA repair protein RecO (recombination protein O)
MPFTAALHDPPEAPHMSKLIRDSGIILHNLRHGDTSSIITLFTRTHGRIGLIAKGARRSPKGGTPLGLELFTEADFLYYYKPTRDLQLLKETDLTDAHLGLRDSLSGVTIGSAIIELLRRCLREDDPHPDLYDATREALQAMEARRAVTLPLLWKFELNLFRALGFDLQLGRCAVTGNALKPPFTGAIRYLLSDGVFLSQPAVSSEAVDGALSADSFAILARLAEADYAFAGRMIVKDRTETEINRFLQQYLESHLPVNGRLQSLEALRWCRASRSQ